MAAVTLRLVQRAPHAGESGLADQRPDQRSGLQRVPDPNLAISALQVVDKRVRDVLRHDQAAQSGAALPGGADRGEQDRPQGQIEIRRGGDDHAVIAAELKERAAETLRDAWSDDCTHAGRAGGADQRHAAVVAQCLPEFSAADRDLAEALAQLVRHVAEARDGPA